MRKSLADYLSWCGAVACEAAAAAWAAVCAAVLIAAMVAVGALLVWVAVSIGPLWSIVILLALIFFFSI